MPCRQLVRWIAVAAEFAASFDVTPANASAVPDPANQTEYAVDTSAALPAQPATPNSTAEPTEAAAAPIDYGWRRGDTVRAVDPNVVIDQPHTAGMPVASIQTSTELQLSLGAALFTCPLRAVDCHTEAGLVGALALLQRPVPWFGWGGSIEAQQISQTWNLGREVWSLEQRVFSTRLLAQVYIPRLGNVGPYIGIGLGTGVIRDSFQERESAETARWLASPLYSARAGLSVRLSNRIELGALVDWTNIQVNTGASCPWIVGGVCSSNNWSAFSPESALWNAAATVSFAFGEEL
jgi:hypothetical protein